ncbi:uncharacterized protein LOC123516732 [Portunus trituberculatus]|uniref:uncharacterized protein LOC123516732 n=1 Tax=Portunus trituberculatus TaxID=210409 RepID=UPI001E1D16FB|nr:uncharacterized protein LOC123516732 [Portunus trituberculatus]
MATTSPTTAAAPDVMGEAEAAAVHFTPLDYTVFVLLLVASLVIGIVSAFKNRYNESTQQYLVGDRKMSPVAVGLSLLGGWVSAVSILGNATEVYFYGTQLMMLLLGFIPAAILVGRVVLPLLYELGIISINEYIELRYGSAALRKLMTLCVLLMNYFYMGVCLYAPSLALTTVTSLPSWAATLIMGSVCTFYITIGGVKAVVYTDVMQTLLMFGGVLAVVITCCQDLGGFGNVWTIAQRGGRISFFDMNTSIFKRHTFLSTFVLGFYTFLNNAGFNSTMFQRFASVSTVQTAVRLNVFLLFGMAVLWIVFFLSGLVAYASYADCDPFTAGLIQKPDQIIPFLVTDRLSRFSGLVGIFVAAVYSGVLSTISSCANSVACVFWEDFLKPRPYFRAFSDAKATNVVKLISAASGVVAILLGLLVEEMGNIFVVVYSVCGAVIGPMTGVYLSGMCAPWVNTVLFSTFRRRLCLLKETSPITETEITPGSTAHDQWGLMCRQLDILEDGISDHPRLRYLVAAYSGLAKQELCSYALSTCMRNLKIMGELKQTYESMHVITEKFKGKLRYPYVDESYRHEELDDGTSCEAKNMLRKVEKDREQIKESSGQHANLPYPSTSATNPEESNFLKKRKRGEITALVKVGAKSQSPGNSVITGAFLNSGRDRSYCTYDLAIVVKELPSSLKGSDAKPSQMLLVRGLPYNVASCTFQIAGGYIGGTTRNLTPWEFCSLGRKASPSNMLQNRRNSKSEWCSGIGGVRLWYLRDRLVFSSHGKRFCTAWSWFATAWANIWDGLSRELAACCLIKLRHFVYVTLMCALKEVEILIGLDIPQALVPLEKTEKVKIVFDCAAPYKALPLNSQVMQGPDLNNNLMGVLLRFRQERVAIMADIKAMLHQMLLLSFGGDGGMWVRPVEGPNYFSYIQRSVYVSSDFGYILAKRRSSAIFTNPLPPPSLSASQGAMMGFTASLIFNLWIVIGKLVRGGGSPSTLPLSTAGCVVPLTNASLHDVPPTTSYVTTLLNTTTTAAANETLDGAAVYDISYCYIGIAGVVITMVVSTLTSLLTGPTRPDSLRKGVVSPTCLKAYTWVWSRLHEHQDDDRRKEIRHLSV